MTVLLLTLGIWCVLGQTTKYTYTFSTLAGLAGIGSADGTGSAARFNQPTGVAVDNSGNVYVADNQNHTIRKITPAGVVSTLAGLAGSSGSTDGTGNGARFFSPAGVAVDSGGNVYVADQGNGTIRKITPGGVVSTLAGQAGSSGSADGVGTSARFLFPNALAVDSAGNVYVSEGGNHTIRKITPGGSVSTSAGLAGSAGSADGTGSAARFNNPFGVAVDSAGSVYVADLNNQTIRKITSGGVVSTLAGAAGSFGNVDGIGSAARFANPAGVAVDGAGNLYVANSEGKTIRKITPTGAVSTLAGLAGNAGSADGLGETARFQQPRGLAVDDAGSVYVADMDNHAIRRITPSGEVSTVAGVAGYGSADGTGSAARFNNPRGVAMDSAGNLFVADALNHIIRKVTGSGAVSTFAGSAGSAGSADGTGNAARFNLPNDVAVDSAGNVFVADTSNQKIRKITPDRTVSTLAGTGVVGSADGVATAAQFNNPWSVALDGSGNLYVADLSNHTIRKLTPGGSVSTLAGAAGSSGSADGAGSTARFDSPHAVAVDGSGNAYVADSNNQTIRKITPAGEVSTLAGLAGSQGSVDGTGSAARFLFPVGVEVDSAGTIYVADGSFTIRKITPDAKVSTVGGAAGMSGSADGTGSGARFRGFNGITIDSAGNLYVADTQNHTIRKGVPVSSVAANDFNGDGKTDVLFQQDDTTVKAWFMDGANRISEASFNPAKPGDGFFGPGPPGSFRDWRAVATGDFNQDGRPDVLFQHADGTLGVFLLNGVNLVSSALLNPAHPGDVSWRAAALGNFNADGKPDLILQHANGTLAAWLMNGTTLASATLLSPSSPEESGFQVRGSGDLDGDGKDDLVFQHSDGRLLGWRMSGTQRQETLALNPSNPGDAALHLATTQDLNGDGKIDLLFQHEDRSVTVWFMDRTNRVSAQVFNPANPGEGWRLVGPIIITAANTPPYITTHPQSQTVAVGASVSFGVVAGGTEPLGYKWSKDGLEMTGATNATLALTNVQTANAGNYAVVVSNKVGTLTSSNALLVVTGASEAVAYAFSTLAGLAGAGSADGVGSAARFKNPRSVAVDSSGNVYVADNANHTIRKITPSGNVSTLAGSPGITGSADGTGSVARFNNPSGLAVDSAGNVFVADTSNHTIRKIAPSGEVSTFAGSAGSTGSTDGSRSAARFWNPNAVAVDSAGDVYVVDAANVTIRKITPFGEVSTLAGTAGAGYGATDGTGSAARFWNPQGIAVDSSGDLYLANTGNYTIRKITPGGVVSTLTGLAGRGSTDGALSTAQFFGPQGVTVDGAGNVYVAEFNHTIRKITPSGEVSTLAGLAGSSGSDDGIGAAARFRNPSGVAVDDFGNLVVSDSQNNTIRKITPAGAVSTLAGLTGIGSADGTGSAARFNGPNRVAVDNSGTVYVADQSNHTIRKITPSGEVSTLAGLAGSSGTTDGTGSAARFNRPAGVAVDNAGNVYVTDNGNATVRKISPGGEVSTLAGLAGSFGSADGAGTAARFVTPSGVAVDSAGNLYVGDALNRTVRKITPDGLVSTLAGSSSQPPGGTDGMGTAARFASPTDVALDSAGNVIVADFGNGRIRKITPDGLVSSVISTPAGGVAVESAGNIFVTNPFDHTIRMVTSGRELITLGGLSGNSGSADGPGSTARFFGPGGVALDSAGSLYVADTQNNTIRKGIRIQASGIVFSDDFSANTIDPAKYQPDAPTFEGGQGNIHAEAGGGVMTFVGTTTQQWWSGATLRVVPTFTATEGSPISISIDRVAEAGLGTASRSALWILDETKTKYVIFADVRGEGGWRYNRKIDQPGDVPTGSGTDIAAFNGGAFDNGGLHRMKMVANGKTVKLFLDEQAGPEIDFPFSRISFQFGSYARANGDTADTTWDNLTIEAIILAPGSVQITGRIKYYAGEESVPDVDLALAGAAGSSAKSSTNGTYQFTVTPGGNYTLTPSKLTEQPPSQGVTTLDITLIRRHILGIAALDSPYKILAADVNGSSTVTTLDIILIRRVILGITNNFPEGALWRFVRSDYQFPDPVAPWNPESTRSATGIAADLAGQDFLGIRLGDVNGSWTAPVAAAGAEVHKASAPGTNARTQTSDAARGAERKDLSPMGTPASPQR